MVNASDSKREVGVVRRGGWLAPRIPALLLCAGILSLFVVMPYRSLDADATTFGIMGNDLWRLGYCPTLTYGQNYLFSFTPYSYAILRWLFPCLDPGLALVLGGAMFSITGLWLLAESLLILLWSRGVNPLLPLWLFCLPIASSSLYIFDIEVCSGIEISLFLLGLIFYAAAHLHAGAGKYPADNLTGWWVLLGMATSATLYTRPQIAFYGAPLVTAFLAGILRHDGARAAIQRGVVLAIGGIAGLLPILAHLLFRAVNWPFHQRLHTEIVLPEVGDTLLRFLTLVAARIFGVHGDNPLLSLISLLWVTSALLAFSLALRRERANHDCVTELDAGWVIGSLGIILAMIATPALVYDGASRRYCLHLLPAAAWLFARFVPAPCWRKWAALVLVASLAAASAPVWLHQMQDEAIDNRRVRAVRDRFIPELMASHAVILTDYWDAYLLAFLADGKIKIEAYPWDWVRTYGLISRDEMNRRTMWLVKFGHGQSTLNQLVEELGTNVIDRITSRNMQEPLLGRECQLWELGDAESSVILMQHHQPLYFSTHYPPGS